MPRTAPGWTRPARIQCGLRPTACWLAQLVKMDHGDTDIPVWLRALATAKYNIYCRCRSFSVSYQKLNTVNGLHPANQPALLQNNMHPHTHTHTLATPYIPPAPASEGRPRQLEGHIRRMKSALVWQSVSVRDRMLNSRVCGGREFGTMKYIYIYIVITPCS